MFHISEPPAFTDRMAGFFLYVSNTTSKKDGHLCFHEMQTLNTTPSADQNINCSIHGRYVFYYNERLPSVTYPSYYSEFAFYELCELEVYGTLHYIFFVSKDQTFFFKSSVNAIQWRCYQTV